MTRPAQNPASEAFLAPLTARLAKLRQLEAAVFWESDGWPEEPAEILEPEEIVFYLEGLLDEGFRLEWRLLALADTPGQPDHLRLFVWENGAEAPPADGPGWAVIDRHSHGA